MESTNGQSENLNMNKNIILVLIVVLLILLIVYVRYYLQFPIIGVWQEQTKQQNIGETSTDQQNMEGATVDQQNIGGTSTNQSKLPKHIIGRYIKINRVVSANSFNPNVPQSVGSTHVLNLSGVVARDDAGNVITLKNATSGCVYDSSPQFDAKLLLKNDSRTFAHTCDVKTLQSPEMSKQWFEIEFERDSTVSEITIFNRVDCCWDRLNGVQVSVLDSNRNIVFTGPIFADINDSRSRTITVAPTI